jgi:hypothetical protein
MYGKDVEAWVRFAISFLLLNIVPLGYFVLVFTWLGSLSDFQVEFWSMVALLIMSLAGFGFYRIYFGIMLLRAGGEFFFYGPQLPERLNTELQQRSERQREVWPHVVPGIVWVLVSLATGWLWTK